MCEFGVFPILLENDLLKVDKILEKGWLFFTALFTNMRILKFKIQPTIAFSLPSIILTDLLGNKTLLRSWFLICDWRISIRFVCSCISRFVTCDRNYDWRQPKTQLWRRLLNFRVRMFLKSTVRQEKTSKDLKRRFSIYCCWVLCSMDQPPFIRVEEAVSWTQPLFNKKNLAQKSKYLYNKQIWKQMFAEILRFK